MRAWFNFLSSTTMMRFKMKHFIWESRLDDGDMAEFVIFARDRCRAGPLQYYFRLNVADLPKAWHPEMWESYEIFGTEQQLTDAYALNQEGLGIYMPEQGWTIVPMGLSERTDA
jgi:hypothetical protein